MAKKNTNERNREITGKMMAILRDHKSSVDRHVAETKLHKSQHRLLMCLARLGDKVSQRDLALNLNITPAAVAVTMKKLEKNGFVVKNVSEEDNRFNEVIMTEKGKKVVKESQRLFRETDEIMFSDFSEEELNQFEAYLDRIQANLKKGK